MKFATSLLFALAFAGSSVAIARVDPLLVPPTQPISAEAGTEFTLHLNNPTELEQLFHWPEEIVASFASEAGRGYVRLERVDSSASAVRVPPMSQRAVTLRLLEPIPGAGGFASLRFISIAANPIMFALERPAQTEPPRGTVPEDTELAASRDLDLSSDLENMRRHIFAYEPSYFAIGTRGRLNARFQFSFKYRLFTSGPPTEAWLQQLARSLHVAYTQTSIWDLEASSKPFYDSSYKPSAFLQYDFAPRFARWQVQMQAGVTHESNGKGDGSAPPSRESGLQSPLTSLRPSDTRSLNTVYFAPKVRWTRENEFFLEAEARARAYFGIDENPDIPEYRGYVALTLRTGFDRGAQLSAHVRGKLDGHGSVELNFTWPVIDTPFVRRIVPASLGGYSLIQYFNGYGESLLDYNVRRRDQLRFGLTIVR